MGCTTANRERWRADLRDFHAAAYDKGGLTAEADAKRSEAELGRVYADLCDELEAARAAALDENGRSNGDAAAWRAFKDAQAEVRAFRELWRGIGEVTGTRSGKSAVVNNFAEPSDEELAS